MARAASADRTGLADLLARTALADQAAAVNVPSDRVLELWALPEGRDPRSVGLLPASGVARIPLGAPAGITFQGITAMAVSLEPAGGSPTGKPTGPVLYTGEIQNLY